MSNVAVFGAGGKLGRHLLPLLHARGDQVKALVHRTPVAGVTAVPGSITDPAAVAATVADCEVVIHLATTKEDPATFFETSLRGTFNVLEACRQAQPRQVVLVSGDAVFGIWFYPQPIPIDEHHPLTAYPGYYAFSKVMEEVMAGQYRVQYGVPTSILRSSWIFEADDLLRHFSLLQNVDPAEPGHGFGAVPEDVLELVRRGQEHLPILVDAAGRPLRRHIVQVQDVIQAFERLLERPESVGRDYNIASPAAFGYRAAADCLAARTGLPTVEIPCPAYHGFEINITRARQELGYAPAYDFAAMAEAALAARAAG
ncbi:MAG: NAD(P)-dependent oxidoreductase [Fimbriimonadaceae bacterium]|nr:NAD(P)-dependent oxidoreductase [Fimbriimonadaceae bacterium]